ncbi:MAG: UDP-glucose 4-epimerase GalE [Oscillospiraceae bacterium]
MSILLTGGAGFIGSHTAVELLNSGYEVIIADNYSNSSPEIISKIERISGKSVVSRCVDIRDEIRLDEIFAENNIEVVIHFAGYKAVGESVDKPIMYYRNNVVSTLSLIETMMKYKVKNIIFSSSATVYGDNTKSPCKETDVTGNCSNPYGWTKYMIEQILKDVTISDSDFSVVSLRYFNPVGAHESGLIGENPKGIPNNLMPYISQVASGKLDCLSIFGNDYPTKDGTGVRDYIHVVDLAKGHVAAINYTIKNKGFEAINLGTGVGYSVLEMVNTFSKINSIKVPFKIAERRLGDLAEVYANADKAFKKLGWKACKTLEEMCRDSWNWQKKISE